jgi:DNA-binding transcriptional regulator GbsR (MarR family)
MHPASSKPKGSRGYAVGLARAPQSEVSGGVRPSFELLAADAVGSFIEFWGFKHNQGRVWTLIYLRGEPMTSAEIQQELSLTKGAVSMITRDLEYWGVLQRLRLSNQRSYRFVAETNLVKLVSRVLREREANVLNQVRTDLEAAEALAQADPQTSAQVLARLRRLRRLAEAAEKTLGVFISSTRFSLTSLLSLMRRSL